jgi:hypothetical protein
MINQVSKTIITKKRSLEDLSAHSHGKQRGKKVRKDHKNEDEKGVLLERTTKSKSKQRLSASAEQLCNHLYE